MTISIDKPIKLTIAALGGQGGGVLSDWLVHLAESQDWLVQSTSVPGVAQRTGATIYYLEFFPRSALHEGKEPVMALMPTPGDVDCVVASELAEAGRVIVRGLVTADRTTLIASSHRAYTIAERSAMGSGAVDSDALTQITHEQAKKLILFDMDELAARHGAFISAVLFGALAGSGVLPFSRGAFERVIADAGGSAAKASLAAFADAFDKAAQGTVTPPAITNKLSQDIPERAASAAGQQLLARVHAFPQQLQPTLLAGVRRLLDYQDPEYATLYLERIYWVTQLDSQPERTLSLVAAQYLALWMSFEDTIRVADLKTRRHRLRRVREEVRAESRQILGVTEFMKPRLEEIAGTLPARLGLWVGQSSFASRLLRRLTGGLHVRSSTVSGFLLLRLIAGRRSGRRATLRYAQENERIERWLSIACGTARRDYAAAVEIVRLQRLVKGYGETHERGLRNFELIMNRVESLIARPNGAADIARLQAAALADEEGATLRRELAGLH